MTKFRIVISKIVHKARAAYLNRFVRKGDFTIISNDCVGGFIYHQLGRKFLTPFINLAISPDDYLFLVENLDDVFTGKMEEVKNTGYSYPTGKIVVSGKDIVFRFIHYSSFAEAIGKWEERKKRVKANSLFFIFDLTGEYDRKEIPEYISRFEQIQLSNKVAITRDKYDFEHSFFIDFKGKNPEWGEVMHFNGRFGKKYIDQLIKSGFFR